MNRILDSGCIRARSLLGIHSLSARLRHSSQSTHPQHGSNGKESKSESRHRHWSDAKIYASSSLDPYFNLAFEDWLFKSSPVSTAVLLFYRNSPSVIIGRNQNPWKEINLPALRQRGIPFVRRRSGGGTVYHDEGNTNYSITVPRQSFDRSTNAELVARAVQSLGPPARMNERHDIVVDGFKGFSRLFLYVSGSAYKIVKDKAYHHGTMLIDADLHDLGDILRNTKTSLETKGVTSVRSPVRNLVDFTPDITHQDFIAAVSKEFSAFYGCENKVTMIDERHEESQDFCQNAMKELKSWEWTYGETPEFTHTLSHTFSFGKITIDIRSKRGIINEAKIHCSSSSTDLDLDDILAKLANDLKGEKYGLPDIGEIEGETRTRRDIIDWLREEM